MCRPCMDSWPLFILCQHLKWHVEKLISLYELYYFVNSLAQFMVPKEQIIKFGSYHAVTYAILFRF